MYITSFLAIGVRPLCFWALHIIWSIATVALKRFVWSRLTTGLHVFLPWLYQLMDYKYTGPHCNSDWLSLHYTVMNIGGWFVCFRNTATDAVKQELLFVGQESGKLLAIRNLVHRVRPYTSTLYIYMYNHIVVQWKLYSGDCWGMAFCLLYRGGCCRGGSSFRHENFLKVINCCLYRGFMYVRAHCKLTILFTCYYTCEQAMR